LNFVHILNPTHFIFTQILNPLKPDGCWEFRMDLREERLAAKIFCGLAVIEPGYNWPDKEFRWKREMDETPGWELKETVMTDADFYTHGVMFFQYFSGENKGLQGCRPDVGTRKVSMHCMFSKFS
jgi:hypothetical protein